MGNSHSCPIPFIFLMRLKNGETGLEWDDSSQTRTVTILLRRNIICTYFIKIIFYKISIWQQKIIFICFY